MKRVRLTLKNYRAFTDETPLKIEIGPGFTALVGCNNSGKSAAKLFFYEFRQMFALLAQPHGSHPSWASILSSDDASLNIDYQGVTDVEEIFNNSNARPASVEIELLDLPDGRYSDHLTKVVATCDRQMRNRWTFSTYRRNDKSTNLSGLQRGKPGEVAPGVVRFENLTIDCNPFIETAIAFRDARYYGPFRNAINQGAGQHYDLKVGTAFIDLWNEWKTSGIRKKSRAIDQVTEDIRRLFEFERLEINASTTLQTLMVNVDGQPYRLSELGSGLAQFIMVLGNAATNPPSLLLIDEPETNLHPTLQIDFLLSLARYAQEGVIFSTHSVGLARSVADRIYSVQRIGRRAVVRPFEATPNYLEFVGELSFSTFKDLGSDRILLVEGVNDVKVVQQLLRLLQKEHTTVILPLGGDQLASDREQELDQLTRLSNNIFALVDSEKPAADAPAKEQREEFAAVCKKLKICVCLTERRALENYFTDRAVKAALGDIFSAIGPHQLLKDAARPWRKGDSWKIAREMERVELEDTDVGKFLQSI